MLDQDLRAKAGKKIWTEIWSNSDQEMWSLDYKKVISDLKNQLMYKQTKRCAIERENCRMWMDKSSIQLFGQSILEVRINTVCMLENREFWRIK
jgi:hypothetical protein